MESVLLEDNPRWTDVQAYDHFVQRESTEHVNALLTAKDMLAIIDTRRRIGKSTLTKLPIKELIKRELLANISKDIIQNDIVPCYRIKND